MTRLGRIFEKVRLLRAVAVVAVLAAGSGAACSKDKPKALPKPPSTTTTTRPEFKLVVASVDVQSMKEGAALSDKVRADVTATLSSYLEKAVVEPLSTGQAAVGLDAVFSPVALARLVPGSPDRAALVEEPVAPAGSVAPDKADVALTALAGQDGEVAVVTAKVDFAVVLTAGTGRLRLQRTGEVALVQVAGGWRIDSYDVVSKRDTVA
jgi:hypothetical protein